MCIGVPCKVIELLNDGGTAVVQSPSEQKQVSLLMMDEPLAIGDYVLIQVGDFAVEKIPTEMALETLNTLEELKGFVSWERNSDV